MQNQGAAPSTGAGRGMPQSRRAAEQNIPTWTMTRLAKTGEFDTYVIGRILYITDDSWEAFLERARTGARRDPAEAARAVAAYRASVAARTGHATERARSGWVQPGIAPARPKKSRQSAALPRSLRPPLAAEQ